MRKFVNAWLDAGHSVSVFAPPPRPGKSYLQHETLIGCSEDTFNLIRTKARAHSNSISSKLLGQTWTSLSTLHLALRAAIQMGRPDIVFVTVPALPSAFTGILLSTLLRVPFAVDLRDAWPDLIKVVRSWDDQATRRPRVRLIESATWAILELGARGFSCVLRHSDLIITTSDWLRDSLRNAGHHNVETIRNSPTAKSGNFVPKTHQPLQRELRVLYAGTIGRAQGLKNAIDAALMVSRYGHEISFRIVGSGAELESLKSYSKSNHAPVEFIDSMPLDEVEAQLEWCDTALVHLRGWEPLERTIPSKLVDLMQHKILVSLVANGESAEIVKSTQSGIVVPPEDPSHLAKAWIELKSKGHSRVNTNLIDQWLSAKANTSTNGEFFVHCLEELALANPHFSSRAIGWFKDSAFLARYAFEIAVEDPINFLQLMSRKMLGSTRGEIGKAVASWVPGATLRALVYIITDNTRDANLVLSRGESRRRLHLYLHRYINDNEKNRSRRNASARELWRRGDVIEALDLLHPRSITSRKWQSTLSLLSENASLTAEVERGKLPSIPRSQILQLRRLKKKDGVPHHRVLHYVTNCLPHTQSGYSIRTHNVLRAQLAAGMDVVAVTRTGYPASIGHPSYKTFSLVDDVTYLHIPPSFASALPKARLESAVRHLVTIGTEFEPTVLHTTTNYENALVVQAAAEILGIPWVYEARGEMEKTWLSRFNKTEQQARKNSYWYREVRQAELRMMEDADRVILLSNVQRDSVIARGLSSSHIAVIPNSCRRADVSGEAASSSDARSELGLVDDLFTVGTITSIVDYEGLDTLVRAISQLKLMGVSDVQCLVVGDGQTRPDLERQISDLKLESQVKLVGKVDQQSIRKWYEAIDVFCVPRRDDEVTRSVTPIKPLQAMAVGRPVIVSDLPALNEITVDQGAGLSVPAEDPISLADAILKLKNNRRLYDSLATEARTAAAKMTWDVAGGRYLSVYDSVTNCH